ncbi:MAG: formylglycine-generating enzyme family protein [Phyllobacterium sp.]
MKTGRGFIGIGILAIGAIVALRIVALAGASNAPSQLGSETLCRTYTGIPDRWPADPEAGMVHVPAGEFILGSNSGFADERPSGNAKVKVRGFWIDRSEVTNAQFARFVRATAYASDAERQGGGAVFHMPSEQELRTRDLAWWTYVRGASWRHPLGPGSDISGKENQPVTLVTQADALAYARWLGRDLPTEAEWEYAGEGGRDTVDPDAPPRDSDGKATANYWQGVFPVLDTAEDGHAGLAPVGCYPGNGFRLHDMIGNAWEWTKDIHTGPHQPHTNGDTAAVAPPSRLHNISMVIKGGSFLCSSNYCMRYRASSRERQEADLPAAHIGFRTVLRTQ